MAIKRKIYEFKNKNIIEVEEHHDGRYGNKGVQRDKKAKPTKEQMAQVNARNKAKRCRHRLLKYFDSGDVWATLTYLPENRPKDMNQALRDFKNFRDRITRRYKKAGRELYWIRNIERGTKGAWHIHIVINEIGNTASLLEECWKAGGVWFTAIKKSRFKGANLSQLAEYLTKNENTREKKKDGTYSKPRLKESNYGTSKNMPLPEPKVEKLKRWRDMPKAKKGYYIASVYEGINPVTRFLYRRYTMIKLGKGVDQEEFMQFTRD